MDVPFLSDVNGLKELKSLRYGWLRPDDTIIPCKLFQHMEVIDKELPGVEDRMVKAEMDARDEWTAELEPDEHPAWHAFPDGDAALKVQIEEIYSRGYFRLGIFRNRRDVVVLEAEGIGEHLEARQKVLSLLASMVDASLLYMTDVSYTRGNKTKKVKV